MRPISIPEVYQLSNGEVITTIRGTVTEINKHLSGNSRGRAWSLQAIIISDGQYQIEVKLGNRPPLPVNYKGRELIFAAAQGATGLCGCYAKDDDGGGKRALTRIVSATETCNVFDAITAQPVQFGGAAMPPQGQPTAFVPPTAGYPPQQQQPAAFQPQPQQQMAAGLPAGALVPPPLTMVDLTKFLDKHSALWSICMDRALDTVKALEKTRGEGTLTPEMVQDLASRLYYGAKDAGFIAAIENQDEPF